MLSRGQKGEDARAVARNTQWIVAVYAAVRPEGRAVHLDVTEFGWSCFL